MKKLLILLLFACSAFLPLKAQNYFEEFGKISQAEIDMKSCSYDAAADAVVLFDMGKSYFVRNGNGFDVIFERITRIKIFNEAGKEYAEVEVPFYQEGNIYEKVSVTKASTYSITDGRISKITTLDPKAVYEEKVSENWKVKKFAMPNVQAGSIIEYVYLVTSQYHFNLRDWDFQWRIPVLNSVYEVRMIPFYEYTWSLQGTKSLTEYKTYVDDRSFKNVFFSTEYYDMVYYFAQKNATAFTDEEFISSREDYIMKIDFQLSAYFHLDGVKIKVMTTWPELVKEYLKLESFGKYLKRSESIALKTINPDSLSGKSETQKFNYIVDYIKDNFKWNNTNSQFTNRTASDLVKDKIGNSAEINLWLVGALRAAGLEAYPLLLSTRSHGKIKSDYPFSSAFNFVVATVTIEGKKMLADATDPFCANNRISTQCMNDKGLLVDKDNMVWISLQMPSLSELNTSIKIDSIGSKQNVKITSVATDYEALSYRKEFAGEKDVLLEKLSKKLYMVEDSSLKIRNATDRTRSYAYSYSFESASEIINNKIYLQPFMNEVFTSNPLKQKTRTYPIDITFPIKRSYKTEIIVPEGYKVEFLPEKSTLNDNLFELEYLSQQYGNTISCSFSYTLKQSVYAPEEYQRVKAVFDRIVKKSSEKIVLVRK